MLKSIRVPNASPQLKSTRTENTSSLVLCKIRGRHLLGNGNSGIRLSHDLHSILNIVVLHLYIYCPF